MSAHGTGIDEVFAVYIAIPFPGYADDGDVSCTESSSCSQHWSQSPAPPARPPLTRDITRFVSRKSLHDHYRDQVEKAPGPIKQMLDGFSIPYSALATLMKSMIRI